MNGRFEVFPVGRRTPGLAEIRPQAERWLSEMLREQKRTRGLNAGSLRDAR